MAGHTRWWASESEAIKVVRITGLPGPSVAARYLESRFMIDPAEGNQVHPALPPLDQASFAHGR
jgi:hypothetical protein